VDKNKQLDLSSIINYFQDCSTFHSEDVGVGIDYLENQKRAWILNSWQININRYPGLFEHITTSTWAYDFKGMYGYRNFIIKDEADQLCASANSIWVFMDTESYRPVKLAEEDYRAYGFEEKLKMDYAPRKIALPDHFSEGNAFPVISANIDTNNHVNNGQYIKMAEEFLPEHFITSQMRAEYRMSATLGDIIIPKINTYHDTCTVVLSNTEDKPYAIIEFMKSPQEG
jgi:Acyl-ACP thioesterase